MGGLSAGLAAALGVADRYLRVETDPRVERIADILPGANCGGCGLPGCRNYAEAVVKGEAPPNKCAPGGSEAAREIAAIMGTEAGEVIKRIAVVHCRSGNNERKVRARYVGPQTCLLADSLGGHTECTYGCLGLGDCVEACTFDALALVDGLPVVDPDRCTACGNCVQACPRGIFSLEPFDAEYGVVYVACNSKDRGPVARRVCDQSCLGCGICEKKSEHGLFEVKDFLAIPDREAIREHPEEADDLIEKCPRSSIVRMYARVKIGKADAA